MQVTEVDAGEPKKRRNFSVRHRAAHGIEGWGTFGLDKKTGVGAFVGVLAA